MQRVLVTCQPVGPLAFSFSSLVFVQAANAGSHCDWSSLPVFQGVHYQQRDYCTINHSVRIHTEQTNSRKQTRLGAACLIGIELIYGALGYTTFVTAHILGTYMYSSSSTLRDIRQRQYSTIVYVCRCRAMYVALPFGNPQAQSQIAKSQSQMSITIIPVMYTLYVGPAAHASRRKLSRYSRG